MPRTELSERVARVLMERLPPAEAKMYGILLARDESGQVGVLRAFSGKLDGTFHHPGWVPPMCELEATPLELETKRRLSELKEALRALKADPAPEFLARQSARWDRLEGRLKNELRAAKADRARRRSLGAPEPELLAESRADSRRKREFKRARREALDDATRRSALVRGQMARVRAERRELSRRLQKELHTRFAAEVWSDRPWSLASLFPSGPPTGTGECCAPKLLHHAARCRLTPLALAEFWWGPSNSTRQKGRFYSACRERCVPLLGPLLSTAIHSIRVLYEDDHLIAVEKPAGLLSVPGRQGWNQDSVLLRLEHSRGDLYPVHRLDLETSGVLLLARRPDSQARLQSLFAQRGVEKTYQALLETRPPAESGQIELPLGPHPTRTGTYTVQESGRPALSTYRVLDSVECRVEFRPLTGRSHQLRVHASQGLGAAIRGDRLYGNAESRERLMLHAERLRFRSPFSDDFLHFVSPVPF